MDPLTASLLASALFKATEKVWEKGFDAAWEPVGTGLKDRFLHLAGKGQERERRAAFAVAAQTARAQTVRQAASPQQTEQVLDALDGKLDKRVAEAFAAEAAKLMLFSAVPDVPRLSALCRRTLNFEALSSNEPPPPAETVAAVLSDYLTNLREALLDQEPYHDLVQHDMRRALNDILAELRPLDYDDEPTYRAQMAELYRELGFIGIPELKERRPITLQDIFIRLRTERETPGGARGAGLAVEESLREAERMVVLGDPGAGKTTLLKYLTVICAERQAEGQLGLRAGDGAPFLPVFISLREFAAKAAARDHDYSLLDYLYTHARERLLLNLGRGFFEEALKSGRCLICLDGLDEIWTVGQRKAVCDAVRALAARFPRSRYIVTSRVVGYEEAPLDRREFVHHTVLPLTDDDIREFVRRWYELRERDPARRKRQIDDLLATIERQPRIKTLAQNPLLLTIIALVHRIEAELPHERVKLYDKCVTALVETWEEVKGLTIAEKQRPFYRTRRRLLERLAFELHTRAEQPGQVQMVKEGDLELLLTRFLVENRRLGLADDPDAARDEARAFVRLARGRTGLLVERGEGVFGFPHLTFQEYLAACDIENRCIYGGADAIWDAIKDRLHDPHWREVLLLLLGSLNKYDELPTLLVEHILRAGEEDKFEPVLHRHLYLAVRALADRVDVAADVRRRMVDALLKIARNAPSWERADAFTAFQWLEGNTYAADGLLALAHDLQVNADVRRAAAVALGNIGYAEEAAVILLDLACDPQIELQMRQKATYSLMSLGRDEKFREALFSLISEPQMPEQVRNAATSYLEFRADGALMSYLSYFSVRLRLLIALASPEQIDEIGDNAKVVERVRRGEDAVAVLLSLIRDLEVATNEWQTAVSLVQHEHAEVRALDVLFALVCDMVEDEHIRRTAYESLKLLAGNGID